MNQEQPTTPLEETNSSPMGGRSFLADDEIRNVERNGEKGFLVRVNLTSYRSLPLSCLEKIELSIDGRPVDPASMRLILNNFVIRLQDFKNMRSVWWYILDQADLFVISPQPLPAGKHYVEALLVTVEPYVTGGRFSFYNASKKYLAVSEE